MASQRYTDLKKLFEDAMPESGLRKDRYTRLGKAMVDELSIPTHWENYAACDELVGGTKRTALGIPPVIILLESKEIDSANRLDMGKRQLKRLHSLRLDAEFGDALAQKAYKEYCAEIDTGMKIE